MADDLLSLLYEQVEDDLDGLTLTPDGLRSVADGRYGEVTVAVDHDPDAEMIRVSVSVPAPLGSGTPFLVWCLSMNARYWDVKLGVDPDGALLVHSDMDAPEGADLEALAEAIVERADTVIDLLDDDLVEWLIEHNLGTPAQRERWVARAPVEDETEE